MRPASVWFVPLIAAGVSLAPAGAQVTVPGTANIFGATKSVAPDPGGGGGGVLPTVILLPPGDDRWVEFHSITGSISSLVGSVPWNGPDGRERLVGTDIQSFEGIAGIHHGSYVMFLTGVFATDAVAFDPAPDRMDASATWRSPVISPELHQTFYIGDGLTDTGSGDVQIFQVPAGATRLFLGFVDGYWFGTPPGGGTGHYLPGSYADNGGELSVSYAVLPTPGAAALLGAGALLLRRR